MAPRAKLITQDDDEEEVVRPMLRARPKSQPVEDDDDEFSDQHVAKVSSGSFLLDKVLGGGWARGRVVNVVGDRSSGKTLLAIEAAANFAIVTDENNIRYAEAEAAFDMGYARSIGMPHGVTFPGMDNEAEKIDTVEKFHADLQGYLAEMRKKKAPGLYVMDSLDALSDDAEMKAKLDDATYGMVKPKKLSKMFRMETANIEAADVTLFIISQIRDKIGVTFGETKTRSGGKALDFYASQIVWLAELSKIKRTVHGVDRVVGVNVLCKTKKNKVAMPFRECKVQILFSYGVDDENSMIDWLNEVKVIQPKDAAARRAELQTVRKQHDVYNMRRIRKELREMVEERWEKIERGLRPTTHKYGDGAF